MKLDEERPAVVVSREDAISGRPEVIIVPFSSTVPLRAPAGVACSAGVAGLDRDSVALCPLVKAVAKKRFKEHVGEMPESLFRAVLRGVGYAVDIGEFGP